MAAGPADHQADDPRPALPTGNNLGGPLGIPKSGPKSGPSVGPTGKRSGTLMRVLVVDAEPSIKPLLDAGLLGSQARVNYTDSLVQAQAQVAAGKVDLLLMGSDLHEQASLRLLADIARHRPTTRTVLVTDQPSMELALKAMRAGVSDVIPAPVQPGELAQRLQGVMQLVWREKRTKQRLQRLKRLCRKLNQARQDIAQQVDVLCGDLVSAYHDLASQVQQTMHAGEFAVTTRGELDLEQYVRKVLEYVLEKAGPTNAAIYLPSGGDEFALGGYVNYDLSSGSPDLLLQDIGDRLVNRIVEGQQTSVHTGRKELSAWAGHEIAGLSECQVLSTTCMHKADTMAVLVLFRHQSQPYGEDVVSAMQSVRELIGDGLAKIIRVHHRCFVDPPEENRGGERRAA
ncbi:MAG: response regulator [Phycisphaerales bacterium]|nr:response regulator [Phycisphaerales bacterium]